MKRCPGRAQSKQRTGFFLLLAGVIVCIAAGLSYGSESFETVFDNLNIKKNTRLHVREYWKTVQGREVLWSGTVFDVKGGRGKAEIRLTHKSRPAAKGFNLSITVLDITKAGSLKRGQQIRFRGYLHSFDSGKHGGVRITLRDAEIIQ